MNYPELFNELIKQDEICLEKNKRLFIVLGSLADFDSFEYMQNLIKVSDKLRDLEIKPIVIAIGDSQSKKKFCEFINMPENILHVFPDALIHQKLKLDDKKIFSLSPIVTLLIMCLGINSPGTIKEVLRGYIGDKAASNIFYTDDQIRIMSNVSFSGSIFDIVSKSDTLRPFELATRRLINMIEIIANWEIYFRFEKFLCQRGGTFCIDDDDNLIYSFKSKGLLGYSESMTKPLEFLKVFCEP